MMTTFIDWFQALPPYMRAYWTIAIAASIIFLIQMTLTLLGLGDTDAGGDMGDLDAGDADLGDGNGTHSSTLAWDTPQHGELPIRHRMGRRLSERRDREPLHAHGGCHPVRLHHGGCIYNNV